MDLLADYLSAQLPATRFIAGVAVQPFCLGHALLLQRLRSPFMDSAAVPGMGDALLALWVCSRPATEAIAQIHGGRIKWWLKWRSWRLRFWEPAALVELVRDHITTGSIGPRVKATHPVPGEPGTPLLLSLLLHQLRLGRAEAVALNSPLRLVKWMFSGAHEGEGNCTIVSEQSITAWWDSWQKNFPNGEQPITKEMYQAIKRRKGGHHGG